MKNKLFWCKQCLNNSYRPRITFDPETKLCNGCMHHRNKFNGVIDWEQRRAVFRKICESHKQKGISYNLRKPDVICPCSGGKDSSYIADKLKKEFGLKVLLVSCRPLIQARMGWRNLENLILSGFDHIRLSPNPTWSKRGIYNPGSPVACF